MSGSGAARRHWWLERITSVALIPLSVWLIYSLGSGNLADLVHFGQWVGQGDTVLGLGLFFLASLYHAKLGLEVIIDDYVSDPGRNRSVHRFAQLILLLALVAAFAGLLHFLT